MQTELIIISYNTAKLTLGCIETAITNGGVDDLLITVVDNNSNDNTLRSIRERYPNVKIIRNPDNYGYAKACNIGVAASESDIVILSNSDIEYRQDSIRLLIDGLEMRSVGLVGPQQFFPNGRFQRSAGFSPGIVQSLFDLGMDKVYRNFCWNTNNSPQYPMGYIDGGVLAFKRELWNKFGGMDEDYFFYTEEADLAYRMANAGLKHTTIREAEVVHYRGSSSDKLPSEESIKMLVQSKYKFLKKHRSTLNRWLTKKIEKANYGMRWKLASKGILVIPDNKKKTLQLLYRAWKEVV